MCNVFLTFTGPVTHVDLGGTSGGSLTQLRRRHWNSMACWARCGEVMALARFDDMLIGIRGLYYPKSIQYNPMYLLYIYMIWHDYWFRWFKMIETSKSSFKKLLLVMRRCGYPYSLVKESMRSLWATKNFPIPFDSLLVQQVARTHRHVP